MQHFSYSQAQIDALRNADAKLGAAISEIGAIKRVVIPDLFTALVNTIVGQQISPKAQQTVWSRVTALLPVITPQTVLSIDPQMLQQCGMSARKARCIHSAADRIYTGGFDLNALVTSSDEDVCKKLSSLSGVGVWTAEMLLLFSLERQDVFSAGDAGIRKGLCCLHDLAHVDEMTFARYKTLYSPNGSVASIYLWEIAARNKRTTMN